MFSPMQTSVVVRGTGDDIHVHNHNNYTVPYSVHTFQVASTCPLKHSLGSSQMLSTMTSTGGRGSRASMRSSKFTGVLGPTAFIAVMLAL